MNDLTLLISMVTSPSAAMMALREKPRFWFPLIITLLLSAGMIYWYYSAVDIEWLKHQLFDNAPQMQKLPEAQRTQAMAFVSRNSLVWGGMLGATFGISVIFVLQATYFVLAGKVTGVRYSFKQWFALTCWTTLPAVLISTIIAALMILTSSDASQLSPGALKPLTLNELFFQRAIGQPGQSLLASFDLLNLWSMGLIVVGVRSWTQRSWWFSAVFALVLTVVIYGVWAFFAFR